MAREPESEAKGKKIVFVSSVLGYFSMVGYSTYAPAKFALRGTSLLTTLSLARGDHCLIGLAETLQSELQLYGVGVHIFFPGTIFSPGLDTENKTKPKVTLKIEESDDGMSPERWADELLKGARA